MYTALTFVEVYLSPFIIAIGLILFFYGIINYFVIGLNLEEGRRETGRQSLLWSALLFGIGLALFGVLHWINNFSDQFTGNTNIEHNVNILPIPNAPGVE